MNATACSSPHQASNVLVLDESTNDLDAETLEFPEGILVDYAGPMLLVSHDQAFLNNVVTSALAFEGTGSSRNTKEASTTGSARAP